MIEALIVVALLVGGVIYMNVRASRLVRNGEWHPASDGQNMRRWIAGNWQYRPMTSSEHLDDISSKAI